MGSLKYCSFRRRPNSRYTFWHVCVVVQYVYLIGESAGAMSTLTHLTLTSESALFAKVIIESNAGSAARALSSATSRSDTFISLAGCNTGDRVACMRAVFTFVEYAF